MGESFRQAIDNLRANKLRSFLTMFGIMWGIVSIVVLSALGEGFRLGNDAVLREFGRNMSIVWGARTGMQAGGERAGRPIILTVDDARAVREQGRLVQAVSPELQRGTNVKSAYNEAAVTVHGVEPPYMFMRTIEVDRGRQLNWSDEENASQVCVIGWEMAKQLFGERDPIGESVLVNGLPYTVVGRIRRKDQDSSYSGPDNNKIFIPFAVMMRNLPRTDQPPGAINQMIVMPKDEVVAQLGTIMSQRTGRVEDIDWPLEREVREILARRKSFDPDDRDAISVWDTSLSTMFFDRMIGAMASFFRLVGIVTLALGGIGVMNIMLIAVKDRTKEIGVRKALGATTAQVQRQFFLEGFFLTLISGGLGLALGVVLCVAVNTLATLPIRFAGMIITWPNALLAVGGLLVIGVVASTLPARRAAQLPPTEALRYEM
jgi:putative ABC transport system permease protein